MAFLPEEAILRIQEKFSTHVGETQQFRGDVSIEVHRDQLLPIVQFCRDELGYSFPIDILAIDFLGKAPRFRVVYELMSLELSKNLRLYVQVDEEDLSVPSIASLFAGADWMEREVYDMHGIHFEGHPDLRRILMWPGYPYYPLRKDFPLEGKESESPGHAFSEPAPLEGGPFTSLSAAHTHEREPRANPAPLD